MSEEAQVLCFLAGANSISAGRSSHQAQSVTYRANGCGTNPFPGGVEPTATPAADACLRSAHPGGVTEQP